MEELKQKIIEDLSNSKLPAECIYYVLKDVYRDVETSYYNYLESKKKQENKTENTENVEK